MAAPRVREYNGVVLGPKGSSEVILAKDLATAKAVMKKKHGPEEEDGAKRWVCGLAPQSVTGHSVS